MSEPTKCAHALCSCLVTDGKKYCNQICEDSHKITALKCDCKHPDCEAGGL